MPHVPESTPVPMPPDWARIDTALLRARELRGDPRVPVPPVPMILAGAAFSSPSQIRRQWVRTIEWANLYGFARVLLAHLPPPPDHDVAERIAGVSEDGQGWWLVYGEQRHEPRRRPTREEIVRAIELLRSRWEEAAGYELARHTRPRRLAGRKRRRLVVEADPAYTPPWGDWVSIMRDPRSFTRLRRAVNEVISPHGVDVIDFATAAWVPGAG